MAFDRPIEADRVDDLGLLSSLIRAPVVGIMWLLGGDHEKEPEEEKMQKQEKQRVENQLMAENLGSDGRDVGGSEDSDDADGNTSSRFHDVRRAVNDDDPPDHDVPKPAPQHGNDTDGHGQDKSNKENELSSLPNWPSVGFIDTDEDASKCKSKQDVHSPRQRDDQSTSVDPAAEMIGDLVAVMESSHITDQKNDSSPGPATHAVLTSQSKMASSSTNSLTASYSASTFSNHHTSQNISLHSSINNGTYPSQTTAQTNSNSSIRGNKKMSWSDECGNRSLVEYFDDSAVPPRSKHWSAMRRNGAKSSRRNSFDGGEKARCSEVRVIKSALKRSGSYSPPVTIYGNDGRGLTASTSSSMESSSTTSSYAHMKSFRSISVIGSSDSSRTNSSDRLSKGSASTDSADTSDSMAAVTSKKLNSNDMQCVPSTLQVGCGRASGGLIIPRGGPSDPRYQLILGAGITGAVGQHTNRRDEGDQGDKSSKDAAKAKVGVSPNPATTIPGGRSSPGHPHFLPRHPNGYVSPQYGFYVNITPPTPELYAKVADKSSKHSVLQQQSYQQFQYQSKYQAPSPIPEGSPGGAQGIPQRFVGRSSVPRPSSNRASQERDQLSAARQNSLKPTFTKNKKGMGMILAENPHHGVWPSVPFG